MSLFTKASSIMRGTPLWVWPLFLFVLYRGLQACKSRTISLYKLAIIPAIFLLLSIQGICTLQCPVPGMQCLWCAGLLLGIIAGWYIFRMSAVISDKKKSLIKIPGSPLTLVLSFISFVVKYYVGYLIATNPTLLLQTHMIVMRILLLSIIPGLLIGRTALYVYLYNKAAHTDL